ncbi:MAG: hypothetical protein GX931_04220 [Acholeplasmataceae bacterium]|jgi:ABC-type lipoprotein export system ATPase subunit|nr:hypothetical protein [Acholeplasmataceae bacterium]
MKILEKSSIWDLHIHTNNCPKGTSEFTTKYKDNTEGFIDEFIKIIDLKEYELLTMISFTDHNQISIDVYKEFWSRHHSVKLLPGVEIDVKISDSSNIKHLIAYFDVTENEFDNFAIKLNKMLAPSRDGKTMDINKLLEKLIELKCDFLISPHAFKQEKRGIDYEWTDEESAKLGKQKFSDQFFCFWEASGYTQIAKAVDFLKEYDKNEMSIVSFSDSKSFDDIKKYLNNPPQYFHSLPNYRGLCLVGTEKTRIRQHPDIFDRSNNSNLIGKICFDGKEILLSKQLNAIIGGRGSGKSLLLDSIANKLGEKLKNSKRKAFVENFDIELYDYNNNVISNIEIEYYDQAYVSNIFTEENFSGKLKEKFSDAFSQIEDIKSEIIQAEIQQKYNSYDDNDTFTEEKFNLEAIDEDFRILTDDKLDISIFKKDGHSIPKTKDAVDYEKALKDIDKNFTNLLPKQINEKEIFKRLKQIFQIAVLKESHDYNIKLIKEKKAINKFIENFIEQKTSMDKSAEKKEEIKDKLTKKINQYARGYIERNKIVNKYFYLSKDFKKTYRRYYSVDGLKKNAFTFSKELDIQTPFEYMSKIFEQYFDKTKLKRIKIENNLPEIMKKYITNPDEILKEKADLLKLNEDLNKLALTPTLRNTIYYLDENNKLQDIENLSPGYQSNILMEYIVHKETTVPLLIDQPEDNVDNQTIYKELTLWFKKLKLKRQVIVVSHDANIVINADSENIIIANQKAEKEFNYNWGAMEYDNIIVNSATILDGGKKAVERRLFKYETGTEKND